MQKLIVRVQNWLYMLASVLCFSASADANDDYRLAAGDSFRVSVYGEPELNMETRLANDGFIRYPFLGEIEVRGLTVNQLQLHIQNGLKGDYLVDPMVQVTMVEYRPFFINGEVARPGAYPYQPGLTVNRAITLAGGFTERAGKSKITIQAEKASPEQRQRVSLEDKVSAGDVLNIPQSFF
ncbi:MULTISPECIES: polysaccharide biosynthesis/export family protein [unclassified Agarivorans]|uniref:polysaccharide biosynthesis/export family protein n=1 Tax=unclassified Agarivorans TaxID=2636026 RepID=UPI0026E1B4ED|nr:MULTISPECIES: polysaccharide biosynthesis/export family protein [unclassified Agarivorans]MDO6686618.1 polysaccharide biosynthesis/export family protein [Agarivorans sp. 3_MG-2023]MDO6715436.1 polysaccharide biosynthesis/export family protein [Agarivorans sp. 2_MG-2023]MDO6763247.1 polysaccharide biosynthesis/export family protein [Agarivorans sp. 1_MG-2023]